MHPFAFAKPPQRLIGDWNRAGAIGIVAPSYGTEKISYGVGPPGYTFHKVTRLPLHRLERENTFWLNTPIVLDYPVELVHTFNELPIGIRPFVLSFEMELPRYLGKPSAWQLDLGFNILESNRCRRILALSDAAAGHLRGQLVPRGLEGLMKKVKVFRGTVLTPPKTSQPDRANPRERPLKLLFVGRDAFRKGLIPTLDALDDCIENSLKFEATIVCDFDPHSYTNKKFSIDAEALIQRVKRMPGVTWYKRLSNQEIHGLMLSHDLLLFPTLDESLGWVAVEAALAGMPVIATDIFAIPEIVCDGVTGFLVPIKKDKSLRWVGLWKEGLELDNEIRATFESIRQHVGNAVQRFADDPELVVSMGQAARAHANSLYGISHIQNELANIYSTALKC